MAEGIKVTPIDIQQKRFHIGFRGYERTEVEMFLDLIRDEMESLIRELTDLREFKQSYDQRLHELNEKEEVVKKTMFMTQKLMEDQKDNARREAALIIKDAEIRTHQIVGSAHEEKARLDAEIQELIRRKHHFFEDLKKVIQMHQEMINFEESGADAKEELPQE
ncbi:MAG TPA: DivIVA domain-containing protein [Nitrospirota bacterium]|nr:DivIVA domain-containing protein [Nitrospirota bacterium]